MNEVEQRLREIEERVSKATPGPWRAVCEATAEETACGRDVYSLTGPEWVEEGDYSFFGEDDAQFIAHARDDVPWLLSLLREREEEVRALRHLLNEIECGTDDIREGLRGCGDHSCIVKKPLGMATNGGCRCVTNNTFEVRVLLGRALRKAARLEEENRRLREALGWLVHLNHGVSKDGGQPTMTEWEDAWEHAEQLLRGEQP